MKQQLEGGIVEAQIELVWGVGLGIWSNNGTTLSYPLLTQLSEVSLNSETAAIEIRPRMIEPRLEVDWYVSNDNAGVAEVEKSSKDFFGKSNLALSPFDRGSFEPLLRAAVTHLDPAGVYWPNKIPAEDRSLPKQESFLKITDTWVVFARPRTSSIFIQDLENLKKAAGTKESPNELPEAVIAIVSNPTTSSAEVELPSFRGLSLTSGGSNPGTGSTGSVKPKDLFFPKPFNDEQVRIVQLLEASDGVVVQGPPGTGKTHTIANVICHFLANGKRVLVTSMKDPALAVLHEKLPDEIKPLAIALLTSEQEGMQQFEGSIKRIAGEVQGLNQSEYRRSIRHLEQSIDALHSKLAKVDYDISQWARKNLERINLDGEEIEPQDAAREVVEKADQFTWLSDKLNIDITFQPKFSDTDVLALRDARRLLGKDLIYLNSVLPLVTEFPDSRMLLQVHQDLSQFTQLTQAVEAGRVPSLANSGQETLSEAQDLLALSEELLDLRGKIQQENRPWSSKVKEKILRKESLDLLSMLDALGSEIGDCVEKRKNFIARPVSTPTALENNTELMEAIDNIILGKRPFGLVGLVGKSQEKTLLSKISILGNSPKTPDEWRHVKNYLALQKQLRNLALRWNTLVPELEMESLPGNDPEHTLISVQYFSLYIKVKDSVLKEIDIVAKTIRVFPNWSSAKSVSQDDIVLGELGRALRHHLTKNRLANVWVMKENFQKSLHGRSGKIVADIQDFLTSKLGNPDVEDSQMQAAWSALMSELTRVHSLSQYFATVLDVTKIIEDSGAPEFSQSLKVPLENTIDHILPDNWRHSWRLRRLATYLESIDAQEKLKALSKTRMEIEIDLAKTYQDTVVKRTWLKLAENASHSIRAALQAYLNAIQKIGKGTGKRAIRYRQDAKAAASLANQAVPCWIMPHYRVSESLPPELGCFDLVVIDEASQSDLTALPALLRAKKVLIVGDDKQVSPEGVGLEEEKVRSLMNRFLGDQVPTYRPQMSPERSIYDLYKVVFAQNGVMLKEHFRCVGSIIEYSKREFYNHELRPLRVPKTSERLDPPLIDVLVEDGFRQSDTNPSEARFIVNEIKAIVGDPKMDSRSIGVVSLLGDKQSLKIWEMLTEELGPEVMQRHHIACGDARTFQGKERDIMFLSMVSAPNEIGAALSRDTFAQRFNVAASRARDRMYLVRSLELDQLSAADKLRRGLIQHFSSPFAQDENRVLDFRKLCESPFEREMYDELIQRGYWVVPQVKVGNYRIDMVVEGNNDSRLAIECDGDRYHGPDKWAEDMHRQRILERAGWIFWRCFASSFVRRRSEILNDLLKKLGERGIEPIGMEGAPRSIHSEKRRVQSFASDPENVEKSIQLL